jgi:Protein of unknown function (DUF1573)
LLSLLPKLIIMKKILLSVVIIATSFAGMSQTGTSTKTAVAEVLVLKETSFDFGQIQQGRPVTHEFYLSNNSTDTLKIENVQASCGCTTPVWNREPVAPGANAKITVGYNAAAEGNFEKNITIFYNGNQTKVMSIKGTVNKAPATPAPENSSMQILKKSN